MKARTSVIIPVFNLKELAERAIKSVLAQDFSKKETEIIVVNDGSTDGVESILDKYSKEVKVINQSNQGSVRASNVGFRSAAGEYIVKLDGDDYFEPGILKKMSSILDKNSEIDFVYSDYREESAGGKKIISPKNVFETVSSGVMFRREKLAGTGYYDERLFFPEYGLFLKNPYWRGFHLKEPLYVYCRRNTSLTGDKSNVERGMKQLEELFPESGDKIKLIRSY